MISAHKMLMKLTPGVHFTNMFMQSFTLTHPKSAKRQSSHQCLFALLGSICRRDFRKSGISGKAWVFLNCLGIYGNAKAVAKMVNEWYLIYYIQNLGKGTTQKTRF
jgi:hypothetical protein